MFEFPNQSALSYGNIKSGCYNVTHKNSLDAKKHSE